MCHVRNASEVSKTVVGRPAERDPVEEIETLGREVYGDDFEKFLATPRRSLDGDTPAILIARGDYARVIALLGQMVNGDFA
jgi:hypothetical protein